MKFVAAVVVLAALVLSVPVLVAAVEVEPEFETV